MPFFADNTSVCGINLKTNDVMSTKSAASIASLSRKIGRMTLHALNLLNEG